MKLMHDQEATTLGSVGVQPIERHMSPNNINTAGSLLISG